MRHYFSFVQSHKKVNNTLFWASVLLVPIFAVLTPDLVRSGVTARVVYGYFWDAKFVVLACALMFSGFVLLVSSLVRKPAIPLAFLMLLSLVAGFANTQKLLYRNTPVLPSDIFMIKDALVSAGEFKIVFSKSLWLLLAASIIITIVLLPVNLPLREDEGRRSSAFVRAACGVAGLFVFVTLLVGVSFNQTALNALGYQPLPKEIALDYLYNTFYPAYLNLIPDTIVKAPEGYSKDTMQKLADDLITISETTADGRQADIIILQVESFFVPDDYDLQYDKDEVFGPLYELMKTSSSGELISPLTGGGTADVEFEMLTGFTSNDNQISTNPFSVYLYDGFPNAVGFLRDNGYETVSLHSYSTNLYNRVNAYKYLGFERSIFFDQFKDPKMHGLWIKDESCIDKAIEVYEDMQNETRMLHIVSMQNHTPVQLDAYSESELVEATSNTISGDDLIAARIFLTSCKEISEQIKRFADYIDSTGRDVVLVVYGDHQIPIIRSVDDVLYTTPLRGDLPSDEGENLAQTHVTPFIVHSTFDKSSARWGRLAPNMILVRAMCEYNVLRPAYFEYLNNSSEIVKSIDADFMILNDDTVVMQFTDDQQRDVLTRRLIQHDIVHGKRYLMNCMY